MNGSYCFVESAVKEVLPRQHTCTLYVRYMYMYTYMHMYMYVAYSVSHTI